MKLSQFKFKLPEELIALNPPRHRDECRLMILHRKSQTIDMFKTDEKGEPLKDEEGIENYTAIIVRNDNPELSAIIAEFTETISLLSSKP